MVKFVQNQCPTWMFTVGAAILACSAMAVSAQNRYAELESLKPNQKEALKKFKSLVEGSVPNDFMKEDIFLVKYLRFANFNIGKAEEMLKEHIKWRLENNVDEALKELPPDLAQFRQEYPIYVDGYDKEDRPICEVPTGQWPIRKAAAAGLIKKLTTYFLISCPERANQKIREQQALGKNVTEWILISNHDGFSVTEHACPACLPFSINLATANDKYWPLSSAGFWFINTPDTFSIVFRLVRPILSPSARAVFKTFPPNPAEWKPFLEKRVDMAQISNWYDESGKVRKV